MFQTMQEAWTLFESTTLLLCFVCAFLIHWYLIKARNYWTNKGVKSVKPRSVLEMFLFPRKKKIVQEEEAEYYQKLGRIHGRYEPTLFSVMPSLMVAEPDLVRDILIKDFNTFPNRRLKPYQDKLKNLSLVFLPDEHWKRVRTIVTPTFSTGKVKRLLTIFKDSADTLLENFRKAIEKGERIELKRLYGAFTMDVIASAAFSTKLNSHDDPDNPFAIGARKMALEYMKFEYLKFLWKILPSFAFKIVYDMIPSKFDYLKQITLGIIAERKKTGQKRNDFLQLLIDAANEQLVDDDEDEKKDEIVDNYGKDAKINTVFKNISTKKLSKDELVAQCVIFFIAGYHTSNLTMSFASYLLALHQDVQDRVFSELKEVLKETNGELTYECLSKLKYLDNVIAETLRLYTPITKVTRTARDDYKLGDTGIVIKKGMVVHIPNYAMHKDPDFFPDPERFDPDRFSPEQRSKQIPYTYLPFGAGPRNCIGMRFALIEMKACLAHVVSRYHIKRSPETKVPLDFLLTRDEPFLDPVEVVVQMELREECPIKK